VRGDEPSEYGDGVVEDAFDGKDVVIGESMTRFARGEVGRPYGVDIVNYWNACWCRLVRSDEWCLYQMQSRFYAGQCLFVPPVAPNILKKYS